MEQLVEIETRQGTYKIEKKYACRSSVIKSKLENKQPIQILRQAQVVDTFLDFLSNKMVSFQCDTNISNQVTELFEELDVDGDVLKQSYLDPLAKRTTNPFITSWSLGWVVVPSVDSIVTHRLPQALTSKYVVDHENNRYYIVDATDDEIKRALQPFKDYNGYSNVPCSIVPTMTILGHLAAKMDQKGHNYVVASGDGSKTFSLSYYEDTKPIVGDLKCCVIL